MVKHVLVFLMLVYSRTYQKLEEKIAEKSVSRL